MPPVSPGLKLRLRVTLVFYDRGPDDDSVVESLSLLFLFGKLKNQYNFWHVIDHFHINFDYNVFTHANHPND